MASSFTTTRLQSSGASLENFVANHGIGTDFALQFARSVFCARLPVTERYVGPGDCILKRQEP